MTRSTAHKDKTRERIVDEAAKAMRLHGYSGIGVADLMKRAGLTHGGFYAHFSSRDELVAHATDKMFQDSAALLSQYLKEDSDGAGLARFINAYLSKTALQNVELACPVPSLTGEASRLPLAARERFAAGVARLQSSIAQVLRNMGKPDPAALAVSVLAEMVGGMAMARAMANETDAIALLKDIRHGLKTRLAVSI